MLTDTALRNLKPKAKPYKASDRDGMYVTVSTTGTYRHVSLRLPSQWPSRNVDHWTVWAVGYFAGDGP